MNCSLNKDGLMNKMYFFLLVFFFSTLGETFAGNIYLVKYPNLADVKVYVVEFPNQADLLVYKTDKILIARDKDEIWYYVEYPNLSDVNICFVDYPNLADIKVYFVEYINQAKWRVENECLGKFKSNSIN